jgi:GrpB-like predicted nucleotidyltransferase (UPF0157 family)
MSGRPDRDEALIGGPERRPIVIAPPDPAWAQRFGRERDRIVDALGPAVLAVHHIGSTSVAGLAAKPIVDIVLVVAEPEDERTYLPALERAGFVLRVREPGHRMVRTPAIDVHVHVWTDAAEVRRHLLFRDWLRRTPEDRRAYQALKQDLARREWDSMDDYADAKGPLIAEITERAERWAAATGWRPEDATVSAPRGRRTSSR